ncbi:copper chaperone [Cohaesibacter marisflavi]|uniref:Copper chaperone n=1 Tax=Cohaesibacter marisflavi TaxID=655353 RepID=A0A1I5EJM8_9HYPH|nr:heavy-metal-associated domain-containing protein [Cohaesibacter marisflavi]SFO11546.1 copper chaperone [Cohaesibacter marisflavi]
MIKLNVQEMACGGCVKSVTEAVKGVDASAEVDASLETGEVKVESGANPEAIRTAIEEAGFPAALA